MSLLEAFKIRYGARLYDNVLLAFSHYEHQQAEQEALMPDPSRQLALNLGSAHVIHTKRRFVSDHDRRLACVNVKVMCNYWLLAHTEQFGRQSVVL